MVISVIEVFTELENAGIRSFHTSGARFGLLLIEKRGLLVTLGEGTWASSLFPHFTQLQVFFFFF